jgi:hypothetical protein
MRWSEGEDKEYDRYIAGHQGVLYEAWTLGATEYGGAWYLSRQGYEIFVEREDPSCGRQPNNNRYSNHNNPSSKKLAGERCVAVLIIAIIITLESVRIGRCGIVEFRS